MTNKLSFRTNIGMTNIMSMIFNPSDRGKIVAKTFPAFTLSICSLETVNQFNIWDT